MYICYIDSKRYSSYITYYHGFSLWYICFVHGTGLPEVTVAPSGRQIVKVTQNIVFTASTSGVGVENFMYQWRHNGTDIDDETNNTLVISDVMESDSGDYECIVTNEYGDSDTSDVVELIAISEWYICNANCIQLVPLSVITYALNVV